MQGNVQFFRFLSLLCGLWAYRGLCELMEGRGNGAKDAHSAVLWIPVGQIGACTGYHCDTTGRFLQLRHPRTLVLFVLTPTQPVLVPWLFQHLLRASGQGRLHEGRSTAWSLLISPISFTRARPLHLIGMSPSWLLPEASEYRPCALVFSVLSEHF